MGNSLPSETLVFIAVCLGIQTLLLAGFAVAAAIGWRRTVAGLADAREAADQQAAELQAHLRRIAGTVDETARSFRRSSAAVDDVVTDMRVTVGHLRHSVGTVASVVAAPRAALAFGVWRGLQLWRNRKGERG
jgi:hypothetical protein